jgi:hypothetical protein
VQGQVKPQAQTQNEPGPSYSNSDPEETYRRKFGLEPGVPADPLDEIILGVRMGTVDISEEGDREVRVSSAIGCFLFMFASMKRRS